MGEYQVLRDVFPEITSFEWLDKAYKNACKQKRYRAEVLDFSNNRDANLLQIQDELLAGAFTFGPYRHHWVYVPKKRMVMALPFRSRVVQWAIYQKLNPFFDKMMIEDSYACREGKGSLKAARRLQYWLKEAEGKKEQWYVLKIDISKYFYRVDHAILHKILQARIDDERLMKLLDGIIDYDGEKFGLPRGASPEDVELGDWLSDVGMPIGNLTSQLFANIYLNELDQFCKHKLHIHRYARYMDDIVIVAKSKEEAVAWKTEIENFLRDSLHLDLNKKTTIMPAGRVEFVGFIVTARDLKIRKQTVRRIKTAFRAICEKYFAEELSQEEFDRRVASYKGMIKHCKTDDLRKRLNQIYIQEREKAMEIFRETEKLRLNSEATPETGAKDNE